MFKETREFVKNNLPILSTLLSLLCGKFLLNIPIFLKKFALITEDIAANTGSLFFTNPLNGNIF
jgi:hypothetical protein